MRRLETVGVVGGGLVGSGWAIVFARAGRTVRLFDASAEIRAGALAGIRRSLADMQAFGLVGDVEAIARRISVVDSLAEAVAEADYVQESVFERVDVKAAVSREIGAAIRDDAVVGSSSSGIPASAFTADVPRRERFLVAHPVNPPHLVPLVELVPAPWTDGAILPWLRQAMEELGQVPVVVNREIEGFVLNRLQGALLNEAWALYEAGLASAADIDRTVAHGLGLRWSFMGPFETIDLNAPGGVRDYVIRYQSIYERIFPSTQRRVDWAGPVIETVEAERRARLPAEGLADRQAWRDRKLMALAAHKRRQVDG